MRQLVLVALAACSGSSPPKVESHLAVPGYHFAIVVPDSFRVLHVSNIEIDREPNQHLDATTWAARIADEQKSGARIGPLIKFAPPAVVLDGLEAVGDKGRVGMWWRPVSDDMALWCFGTPKGEANAHTCFDAKLFGDGLHVPVRLDGTRMTFSYTDDDVKEVDFVLRRAKDASPAELKMKHVIHRADGPFEILCIVKDDPNEAVVARGEALCNKLEPMAP